MAPAFALDEYRRGHLREDALRRMLGFTSRYQLDGFLKANDACYRQDIMEVLPYRGHGESRANAAETRRSCKAATD
jgi:hypothetical protein